MSQNPIPFKFTATLIAMSALVACGGGGGDAPATTPAPVNTATPPPAGGAATTAIYTKDDAEDVAGLGFLASELITQRAQIEQPALAYFAQGFLSSKTATGSSVPTTVSCATASGGSGTLTATVTKSGTYVGLKTNDKIDVSFNNCNYGAGDVLNGRLVATSQADYADLGASGTGFKFNFQLASINYQQALSTTRIVSNCVQNVQFDATASANYPKLTSSTASICSTKFFTPALATTASLEITLNMGATVTSQFTSAGANYSSTVDGAIALSVPPETISLILATPVPVTGAVTSGRLVPAAGVLRVKDFDANLQTESTVQGSMVQVKADTNRDGTLDLTFSTTYSMLTN
jgi:hypothetical protein